MIEFFLNILKFILKNLIAIIALVFSMYTLFISVKLKMEPFIKIQLPFEFTGTDVLLHIENVSKADIINLSVSWATLIKEPVSKLAGRSPVSQKLKAKKQEQYTLNLREEIEKLNIKISNVFYLSVKAVYKRKVDMQPRQNTFYFMLSLHSFGVTTEDITAWKQKRFMDIKKELDELIIVEGEWSQDLLASG